MDGRTKGFITTLKRHVLKLLKWELISSSTSFQTEVMEERKNCLFCGEVLQGRSDKRFCADICRNNHHYKNRKDAEMLIKDVNAILLRNREILRSLSNNRSIVAKQILIDEAFNFDLITAIYKTKRSEEYRVVYDYAYRFINYDEILLIKYLSL